MLMLDVYIVEGLIDKRFFGEDRRMKATPAQNAGRILPSWKTQSAAKLIAKSVYDIPGQVLAYSQLDST